MSESKENLKKRIDTNKNQYIENNEVDNFAKDKKNWDIDLNNLWEYLNNLPLYNNDELKKALNKFFRSPERNKYDQTIKNKVKNNQPLDKTELSLMYLAMIAEPNKHLTQQQLKFDSNKPVDQICDWALIRFIRTKYNFPTYTWKKVKIDLPNETKKKTNSPIDKIQESKKWDTKLPENIWEIKESEADFYCDRLITRAEKNFANDIEKAKREVEQKHRYKNEEEKKAYIKRDTLLIAFSKYTEAINSQHEKHISNSWYKNKTDFENQMKLIEEFWKEIERKYPNINNILEKVKKFDEEMKANEKKYFKNENETKKAEKNYKEFNEYMDKKSKEYNIDKIQESLKKEPKTKEEMGEYLQTMNKIFEFQEDLNKKNKTYWDSISKYQKYIKWAIDIQKKHNIQEYQEILEKYNQDITNWNKKIDFKKYENYKNWLDWKLEVWLKNINTLQWIIINPQNEYFPVKEIREVERKKQIKQDWIDRFRERLKKFSPWAYWTLTTFTWLWNWLIDATIWVSTSLWVMILWIIWWRDETLSQMDRKAKRDDFFKIGQSSKQKEAVYSPETWFNFNADNTVSTVASSISQMLTLIYWWWAIWSWATKVFWISESIAWRVWLFTSSFITQVWWSYQEAIKNWLDWKNAIWYSFLSASIQSSLELISPNDVLLWKWSGITKELIRNACNAWWKKWFMLIWKTFLKNVWLDIIKEDIQEWIQTVAWNLINMVVNKIYWSKLETDRSWKNFAATAIITTLTTWITTWVSTWIQMYEMSNQDQTRLIESIKKSNNWLYLEVTWMLDKAIEGKVNIPNVSIQQLQELKLKLTWNNSSETNIPWTNINNPSHHTNTDIIQTNYEITLPKEAERYTQILWSKFHEERRKSRLKSDWTYEPRIEKATDQEWISQHNWQTEVDIANTNFEDLPSNRRYENLEAAKVAIGLIFEKVSKWEKITQKMIEEMSERVHNKRLERNWTEWSFENQRVPYEQLSEEEKAKDRNQVIRAIETVTNWKSQWEINIPSWKFEAPNEIANFNDENWKFEYNNWILILKENWEEMWNAILKIEENCINISWLVSFKQWSWTQLIKKIVEISEKLWKWWHIEAEASPYFSFNWQKSYRNQLTNLWFYYKLGFKAKDPEIHKKIQEYIDKWEEIPLWLNAKTSIYLTDEWIQKLKNKDNPWNDYFDWKSHQFEVTEAQAHSNSENMDNLVNEINEENLKEKLQKLKNNIEQQYKQATWEELQLSDEQLLSIIDAHEQDWILWELTLWQLRKKVKILDETIKDEKIRRFLLEFWFCWSRFGGILGTKNKIPQYQLNNSNNEKKTHYYQINEWVRIPRSNWSSTRAKITSYNQWIYTVEWSENGHIKAKELTQQEIDQENQLKMNPEEITRFNKNLPLVYRKWWLYPRHKINIWDWTTLYTTDKIVGKNSWRQYIIWYTFDNYWTMHLRQFYRSMSEWCWRACPWMREDWNLSKWEFITDSSYETTTKVDLSLWNTFDNLKQTYYNDFWPYNNYFSYSPISYIASSYNKNYILSEDMWPQNIYIRKLFPNLVWNDKTWHNKYNATDFYAWKYWHTIESVTKWYNNLVPEWLDYKHMKLNPNKSYSYHHEYLWNVNVQVCTIKRKGIDLDFHFARAINSPDKVWIENVACSDAQLNSWWVYNKQINAWPLVAKPVDYKEQCPNWGNIDQILPKVSPDYRDIRNLYQWNPIIKKFKQISR